MALAKTIDEDAMTFVPAYQNARLRFLLQFMPAGGTELEIPPGAYVCDFYRSAGAPPAFSLSTADGSLLIRTATGGKGIEFDKDMAQISALEARRYIWELRKIGTPNEWFAAGDMKVDASGEVGARFRVFEAWNGVLPRVVAPAFQGQKGDTASFEAVTVEYGASASGIVSGPPGSQVLHITLPTWEGKINAAIASRHLVNI